MRELLRIGLIIILSCTVLHVAATGTYTATEDTIPEIEHTFHPKQLILPGSLIAAGILGTAIDGMSDFHLFNRGVNDDKLYFDDVLEYSLLGLTFAYNFAADAKHHWIDQIFLLGLAEWMNIVMVQSIKHTTDIRRPNYSNSSFPSGHTANGFVGAQLAYKEFKDTNPLLAFSGYPAAVLVGFARIYSNRHWLADVAAGAGIGILSVELSYLAYPYLRNEITRFLNRESRNKLVIAPVLHLNGGGVHISYVF
jgi:membrane-associated phospholipid phosphatase